MRKLKNAASNFWLQLGVIATFAIAVGVFMLPISPFDTEASATDFSADKSQGDALADGVVTREEYNSATNRMHACIRASGGEIIGLRYEDYRNVPVWASSSKS